MTIYPRKRVNRDIFILCKWYFLHFFLTGFESWVLGKLGPGQLGPGQLGPDNGAQDSWAPGPNRPLFHGGQLGPG